jgi:hypothetical protein
MRAIIIEPLPQHLAIGRSRFVERADGGIDLDQILMTGDELRIEVPRLG